MGIAIDGEPRHEEEFRAENEPPRRHPTCSSSHLDKSKWSSRTSHRRVRRPEATFCPCLRLRPVLCTHFSQDTTTAFGPSGSSCRTSASVWRGEEGYQSHCYFHSPIRDGVEAFRNPRYAYLFSLNSVPVLTMLLSDLSSSLTACGGDSITFAQLRGRILKELGVDLPTTYLSETYTMGDIVDFVVKGA